MNGNEPRLRFPEYSDCYDNEILENMIAISKEKYKPIKSEDIFDIELEHIVQDAGTISGHTFSSTQKSTKSKFYKGQVLYGKLRPYLKKYWFAECDGVCSGEIWVLNGLKLINTYLFYLVQTDKFTEIANISSGSKMPRADWNLMKNINFYYPTVEEQVKIGDFLSTIDSRITNQSSKLDSLQELKKGVMQKIFSQEIRFKREDGGEYPEWSEFSLGEISRLYQPKTISQKELTSSGYPVFGANGQIGWYDNYNQEYEQIAITCRGNTCGTINITPAKSWVTGNAMIVDLADRNMFKYISQYLQYVDMSNVITGSGQPQITKESLQGMIVLIPENIEEQQKIADFLSTLDSKISLESQILETLQTLKKGLLQQMFV